MTDLRSAPVGSLRTLDMYPMDLEEFLYGIGIQPIVIDELKECYEKRKPVDEFIHKRLIEAFYIYLIVGGMASAVQAYVKENDFNKVMQEHNAIIPMYKRDFSKYETENKKLKLHKIYDLIPSEISSKNKRYVYSNLDKEHRPERYESSFEWLEKAGVSNINYGAMFENVVAQELKAHGYNGYYFNSKKQGELDFLIEYENKCLPIEVKSGKDYKVHSALNNVLNNENYDIPYAYVLSNGNVEINEKIVYLDYVY